MTRTTGPVGISYDESSAGMLAHVDADTFADLYDLAREADQIRENTSPFSDAAGTVYAVTLDGSSGYAVRADGELVFVFSLVRGRGDSLVEHAVRVNGATRLDCFDGYLPSLYARHGFVEYRREPNWTAGEPDVVYMSRYACRHCGAEYGH